jgi:STE24 endopeptidase
MNKFLMIIAAIILFAVIPIWADSLNTPPNTINDMSAVTADSMKTAGTVAPQSETGAPADTIFPVTPQRRELLNKYSSFSFKWSLFYDVLQWALLLIILFSGLSKKFLNLAEKLSGRNSVQFLLFLLILFVFMTVITMPLDFFRDYIVEHNYSLSNQSVGSWFGDWAKAIPISYIMMALAFGFIYFLIKRFPRRWWLVFSIGAIPFVIMMLVVTPVLIAPLFNDFKPLQDQQLKTHLLDLAGKAGIDGADVFQVDASKQSKKLNAYVTGLFSTKRIVLYDTIIKAMTTDELMFVMAHEMGHYVMNHVWIMVGMIIIMMLICTWIIAEFLPRVILKYSGRLGFADLKSYASMPFIMLAFSLIMFFIQPATNSITRSFEHSADKFGMEMTNFNGEAAAVAFEKLSAYNLSDPNPGALREFWFYNHPALYKRIEFVKGYKGE